MSKKETEELSRNEKMILALFSKTKKTSVYDLAKRSSLTYPTVAAYVNRLASKGVVSRIGEVAASRGGTKIIYELSREGAMLAEKVSEEADKEATQKRTAFVICPIGDPDSTVRRRADQILKHVIEPVLSECGYEVLRADKISKPGIITTQVIEHIVGDSIVIADLTGSNPNVFYELAVRHAIKKPVIQIIEKGEQIPFDVSTTRTIQIDHQDLDSVDGAKKEVLKQVKALQKDPSLVDSPVSVAVDMQFLKQSGNPERIAIAELSASLRETNLMVREMYRKMLPEEYRQMLFRYTKKCPECGSGHLVRDYDTLELICADCGLVIVESPIINNLFKRPKSAIKAKRRTMRDIQRVDEKRKGI